MEKKGPKILSGNARMVWLVLRLLGVALESTGSAGIVWFPSLKFLGILWFSVHSKQAFFFFTRVIFSKMPVKCGSNSRITSPIAGSNGGYNWGAVAFHCRVLLKIRMHVRHVSKSTPATTFVFGDKKTA
jgi:hypothetical protein